MKKELRERNIIAITKSSLSLFHTLSLYSYKFKTSRKSFQIYLIM